MKNDIKKYAVSAACAIGLCALSAYITMSVMGSSAQVTVPDISGLSTQEARDELRGMGLALVVEAEEFDSSTPAGHVIKQDTPPGTRVKGHSGLVRVMVSRGLKVQRIPNVIGMKIDQARALFRQKSIVIGKEILVHSDSIPDGQIIAQNPMPEQWAGGAITVIASMGPADVIYFCPDFTGMTKQEALDLADQLGISTSIKEPSNTNFDLKISSQSPAPGTEILKSGIVYLTIGGNNG